MVIVLGSASSQYPSNSVENLIHRDVRHACTGTEGTVFFLARNAIKILDNNQVSPSDRSRTTGIGGAEKSHNRRLYRGSEMKRSSISAHEAFAPGKQCRGFRYR